ncbi:hypothetical protein NIES4071_103680 (plasmid) [Calothrix sp. NIES-4071]|nr:hypothetical protein NIES4071_103680 [Calothrix sp. NIES-4071]BAZ64355.1 hypothetical protein NIES4105_100880 [Calothrix sp. NIES-4105]
MKTLEIVATSLSISTFVMPVSANVVSNEFQMEVECSVTRNDMLDITLSGRTRSEFKGANLKVTAIPSGQVITETKSLPSSGTDGQPTPTDRFGLFVAPYSPNTTAIQVTGNIQSSNGSLKVNSTTNCQ